MFSPSDPAIQIKEGAEIGSSLIITAEAMNVFRCLSGDENALHHNAPYARAQGFRGPVVYGGLLVAHISRILGTQMPGHGCVWHSLSLQFKNPLYVDEAAVISGRINYVNEELRVLRIKLRITVGERLIASGEAQAGWSQSATGTFLS